MTRMFEATTISQVEFTVDEIVIVGDWAFERHLDSAVYTPNAGGDSRHLFNKGIFILRRQPDNDWKIARYVWNGNPAPAGAEEATAASPPRP